MRKRPKRYDLEKRHAESGSMKQHYFKKNTRQTKATWEMMTSHLSTQNQLRTEVTSHVRRWSMRCNEQPPVILFCTLMPIYDVIAATGPYPQSSRCLGYLISFFWREARSKALTLKRKPTRNESRLVFCRKFPSFCDSGQRQGKDSFLEQSQESKGWEITIKLMSTDRL